MKSNTSKLSSNNSIPAPNMQIADALAYFNFSTGYPEWTVDTASITDAYLQEIGLTLIDGVSESIIKNDLELLKKCTIALRERLCFNVEEMRVQFKIGGPNVISIMSPFQLALLFSYLPLCEYLFSFAMAMPESAMREGIDAPLPMIIQLGRHLSQANPTYTAQIKLMVQSFSESFAASLALTNPQELDPTKGILFKPKWLAVMGFAAPIITDALRKHGSLLVQQHLQKSTPHPNVCNDPVRKDRL